MRENERECKCLTCNQNRQEASLVYCTNRTKRLMGKTKKKITEQSIVREGSPMRGVGSMMGRISGKGTF